jgi:hypothetical protein
MTCRTHTKTMLQNNILLQRTTCLVNLWPVADISCWQNRDDL